MVFNFLWVFCILIECIINKGLLIKFLDLFNSFGCGVLLDWEEGLGVDYFCFEDKDWDLSFIVNRLLIKLWIVKIVIVVKVKI